MVRLGRNISLWKKDERLKSLSKARPLYRSSYLDIRITPQQSDIARLIVITPRKVGSAPFRNLLRRRVKSIFYEEKMYQSRFNWIFFFRPCELIITYKELATITKELFKTYD